MHVHQGIGSLASACVPRVDHADEGRCFQEEQDAPRRALLLMNTPGCETDRMVVFVRGLGLLLLLLLPLNFARLRCNGG